MMRMEHGCLYGVGVGPGDPDLITVKALDTLRNVDKVFAACSTKNDYSLSKTIVTKHLGETDIEEMPFPMTRDGEALHAAWEKNARRVLETLHEGRNAAFVTLGDPLTFSTFSYLLRTVRRLDPEVRVKTVPGITSYQAGAAAANTPLAEGEESLHVISGAHGGEKLRRVAESADNLVILKVYKHFEDIYATLEELNLLDRALLVSRCGLEDETVLIDLRSCRDKKTPYLSLMVVKKTGMI
jgi:precorrin-2/cobalt-factor-2 C20-methyltransferase